MIKERQGRVRITWWDENDGAREKRLRGLYAEGLSAARIARRMQQDEPTPPEGEQPKPSRNAVISKLHRLGIVDPTVVRRDPRQKAPPKKRPERQPPPKLPKFTIDPYTPRDPDYTPPMEQRVGGVCDLETHHCRWPLGDPRDADFAFCGGTRESGIPYCRHHAVIAFAPPQVKNPNAGLEIRAPDGDLRVGLGEGSQKEKAPASGAEKAREVA